MSARRGTDPTLVTAEELERQAQGVDGRLRIEVRVWSRPPEDSVPQKARTALRRDRNLQRLCAERDRLLDLAIGRRLQDAVQQRSGNGPEAALHSVDAALKDLEAKTRLWVRVFVVFGRSFSTEVRLADVPDNDLAAIMRQKIEILEALIRERHGARVDASGLRSDLIAARTWRQLRAFGRGEISLPTYLGRYREAEREATRSLPPAEVARIRDRAKQALTAFLTGIGALAATKDLGLTELVDEALDAAPIPLRKRAVGAGEGDVLYEANWSQGADGWHGTYSEELPDAWHVIDGTLVLDTGAAYTVYPPVDLAGISNFAVEIEASGSREPRRGRGECRDGGLAFCGRGAERIGYYATIHTDDAATSGTIAIEYGYPQFLFGQFGNWNLHMDGGHTVGVVRGFDPGTAWHTYRLEAQGPQFRLLVDGQLVISAEDDKLPHHQGGRLEIAAWNCSWSIRGFRLIRLRG